MQNPGIPELHRICPNSGALIFPPNKQAEDTKALEQKVAKQDALIAALLNALPKTTRDKIPSELLEGVTDAP